jgi:23S rRNA (cytidine1920-2'-O)/16S rRNA (cytidine1409-2'-O)-methyltransferase
MTRGQEHPFVSRGGVKLRHALDELNIDVRGMRCVDLGCSTGGFTDCLLQAGAARVVAVDTGYGVLAYRLRIDPRVLVLERASALHVEIPAGEGGVDLAVIDLGWTPQRLAIPAALRWLGPGGRILTLVKPHYEAEKLGKAGLLKGGVLEEADAQEIAREVIELMPALGVEVIGSTRSPLSGGKQRSQGNAEWLVLARPSSTS